MPAELSEQIQRFEEKYAENPDSLVFARLADLYRKAGDADRGLRLLQEGLERHPDYLSAHIVRARCLRDLDRQGEAEEAFERVLERDEQNLVALRGLAEIARGRGDVDEAERRFEELLALDPHNEEARSALEELVEGGAPEPPPPDEATGPDLGEADAVDEGPWWRSGEPEDPGPPEEHVASGEPAVPDEAAPAGADQSDVFSLAGPEDEGTGDAAGEGTGPAEDPAPEPASREEAEFLGLDGGEDDPDGELPAEEELTERIEEIADTAGDEVPAGMEDGGDAEDLLTETLADLYETQGFYREAVEMYEELLEERPEDDELRARLEAARSAMDEAGPDESGGEADAEEVPAGDGERVDPASEEDEAGPAGRDGAEAGSGPAEGPGEPAPSRGDVSGGREPASSARAHLRALLRGEAGEGRSVSEGPERGP